MRLGHPRAMRRLVAGVAMAAVLTCLSGTAEAATGLRTGAYPPTGQIFTSTGTFYAGAAAVEPAISSDHSAVELGIRFQVLTTGRISGVLFYKGAGNTGGHSAGLWTESGMPLATARFSNETDVGWQYARFDAPVTVVAGYAYIAGYHTDQGHYADEESAFDNGQTIGTADLVATAGVYRYTRSAVVPRRMWRNSSYFVDVRYAAGLGNPRSGRRYLS